MHADPKGVLTGMHFLDGDHACCEGALAAGARFAAGYPITPSTEVVERFAARIPTVGGIFIQMEDELAASIAIQGAVWGGAKAFTVTSGPGFSLMMEHIGYAAMTETPCVFVNVQRGGPSTGLPTLPAQADMMQARWGSHGDYGIIALCPNSPQECFDLTIKAFNLSEEFRVPVMVMMDEVRGPHDRKGRHPASRADRSHAAPVHHASRPRSICPIEPTADLVPEMVQAGEGYRFHVTGLTHDERGYPSMNVAGAGPAGAPPAGQDRNRWPNGRRAVRSRGPGGCRSGGGLLRHHLARGAARHRAGARPQGIRVGKFRLITAWPFPEQRIRELAERVKAFVVPELNLGQMVHEVERARRRQAQDDLRSATPAAACTIPKQF